MSPPLVTRGLEAGGRPAAALLRGIAGETHAMGPICLKQARPPQHTPPEVAGWEEAGGRGQPPPPLIGSLAPTGTCQTAVPHARAAPRRPGRGPQRAAGNRDHGQAGGRTRRLLALRICGLLTVRADRAPPPILSKPETERGRGRETDRQTETDKRERGWKRETDCFSLLLFPDYSLGKPGLGSLSPGCRQTATPSQNEATRHNEPMAGHCGAAAGFQSTLKEHVRIGPVCPG